MTFFHRLSNGLLVPIAVEGFDSIAIAETRAGINNNLIFVGATATIYRYISTENTYITDHEYILDTPDNPNHKWIGMVGPYALGQEFSCDDFVSLGHPVRISGYLTVTSARATSKANSRIVGFVVGKRLSTKCNIRNNEAVVSVSGSFTIGEPAYLGLDAGEILQSSAPTAIGSERVYLGEFISSNKIYVNIDKTTVTRQS